MSVFKFIIAPFLQFIELVFNQSYNITLNYGLSIILLSFSVSLLLLPIFILIEKAKKRDDAVKRKMKPQLDEIKRCYKGQERYYYIKTLNRQHNFSPIRSLIPILSLLLQIPFFIAAYQFLENFEPLEGVGFLFINDLSAPDALFGVVNFLPIAMTMVNLLTAYFYTRNGDTSERKQMLGVAAVFLVLLFNLPSGLVLYWTMNNVFSFLRLFVTNREVFRKSESSASINSIKLTELKLRLKLLVPKLKVTFWVLVLLSIALQINWAFDNNFDTIFIRLFCAVLVGVILTLIIGLIILLYKQYKPYITKIQVRPKIFYSLMFFAVYFHLAARFYFNGINDNLNLISMVALIPLQIIGALYVAKLMKTKKTFFLNLSLLLLLFVFFSQIINLIVFISGDSISLTFLNTNIQVVNTALSNIVLAGIIFSLITISFYVKTNKITYIAHSKYNWGPYILALIYILGLIFFWNPLIVYSSFPETFSFAAIKIIFHNFYFFLTIIAIAVSIYIISPKPIKLTLTILSVSLSFIAFVYNSIFPINVGSLQMGKYIQAENLIKQPYYFILEGIFLLGVFLFVKWMFKNNYSKLISYIISLLIIVLIVQSLYTSINSGNFIKKEKISTDNSNSLSFSKEKENIVVFIADMFLGYYMHYYLNEIPEFKDDFDGFIWYPNTLSASSITSTSICPILGGFEYTIDQLNKDTQRSMAKKTSEVTKNFVAKIKNKGYHFTSNDMIYSDIDKNSFDIYIPKWHDDWNKLNEDLNIGNTKELDFTILRKNALFYASPLFLKSKIYNNGEWINNEIETNENTEITKPYNFIRILPHISNSYNNQGNFIYYHCKATHLPWSMIDDEGKLVENVTPYENQKWFLKTFVKWIEWMKENDVYDNTKIILLSDHAHYLSNDKVEKFGDHLEWDKEGKEKLSSIYFWRLNALLMVKDFNSKGELKEDWRFMSNADMTSIAFNENDPTKALPPTTRILPVTFVNYMGKIDKQKKIEIIHQFHVTDNLYDSKNWEKVK